MADTNTNAGLEYEALGQWAKLILLYCGLLATLHKLQTEPRSVRPFEGRDGFAEELGNLYDHFFRTRPGKRSAQIRATNQGTQRQLAEFLTGTYDRFADSIGPNIPNELRSFRNVLRADQSLAAQLKGLKLELTGQRPITFPDTAAKNYDLVTPFLKLAAACLGQTEHPTLPGVDASYELALACEHSGFIEAPGDSAWKQTGLFSIVREARGPYTNDGPDINVVVRDLLWIRRRVGEDPSRRVSDENSPGGDIGFYFSAFDGIVYEVRNIKIRNRMLMIDAISFMKTGTERSLCIYYPESNHDHALHCREGILMGTLRDERRPGAWKTFIIRPDWKDALSLDLGLGIYISILKDLDRDEYNAKVQKCFEFVSSNNLIGVLYSRDWARRYPDLALDSTRGFFRSMLWERRALARRDQIFVGSRVDEALRNQLASVLGETRSSPPTLDAVMEALHTVLTQNWHLIEPPQLISSGYSPDEFHADPAAENALRDFVRRDRILAYTDYARQMRRTAGPGA